MLTRSRVRTVTLAVVLTAAVLGFIAGLYRPSLIGSATDRVLRVASAVSVLLMVGVAIVAKRLPVRDVSRFERWLRALFFVGHA